MAVYAAANELLHDFFHHCETAHWILESVGTKHAIGFVALSHLSEHFKEYLEEQDKPLFHIEETKRMEFIRIFSAAKQPMCAAARPSRPRARARARTRL